MKNKWLQWALTLGVLAILAVVFRKELNFLRDGFARLAHADPGAVAVVIAASLASLVCMAEVMRLLVRAGAVSVNHREATAVTLAANAWSTTLPAGAAFSAVFTFYVQRTWGATVALCGWFLVLSSAVSTVWLVLIGLGSVLLLNANMAVWSLIATMVAMLALTWLVFWASNNPRHIESWLRRQRLVKGDKREAIIAQVHNLNEMHLSLGQFLLVSGYSLANRVFDMVSLWACAWAITGSMPGLTAGQSHTTAAGVALAYITAKLAGSAQVTPAGLGTVEAAIIATLVATGMTAVEATGTAVIYRLISFVLMASIGWVIYFWHYARNGITYAALNRKEPASR